MYKLNRQTRYEIIKELILQLSPSALKRLVIMSNFKGYNNNDDIEYRRRELLSYLDEMNNCWKEHNLDMTDRQYIVIEPTKPKTKKLI